MQYRKCHWYQQCTAARSAFEEVIWFPATGQDMKSPFLYSFPLLIKGPIKGSLTTTFVPELNCKPFYVPHSGQEDI